VALRKSKDHPFVVQVELRASSRRHGRRLALGYGGGEIGRPVVCGRARGGGSGQQEKARAMGSTEMICAVLKTVDKSRMDSFTTMHLTEAPTSTFPSLQYEPP
jgi:hypothetical protein